ncbi:MULTISPECIES: ABC transporter ATP-binding protein [unclassified Treponema]|uniref:ABC transporter ATP-binding protein n=1 Tax=unclassified Treponema TaxID=2638727 RepID=UPI0020A27BF2|nr:MULTISPECIES: ABC transporter ATP-binding protein [unclassified Treponema]UTC44347.1 ABC transporter ATP-binding protein [Treponema sp. OMZ 857]UTC51246.1 ABC transporter ATP-binding protein [Treponema sp. OMZ 855]
MADISLVLKDVTKTFPERNGGIFNAVDKVNIEVAKGEMVTFLGPSGCGKTTTLRMIAGFVSPTSGSITIAGKDMTSVPVNERAIGFVFQNYALFPHMTIYKNVGYGLKARGEKDADIHDKIINALKLVGLSGDENRYPNQLSGGEQQRVALARVIVMEPSLLLMDEPLSNLDAKLRIHMRTEIRRIQKALGTTCLYVTHDQSEALTVSDRIVVMSRGKVEQIGTPLEIYGSPASTFVADFIGQANIVPAKVQKIEGDMITASISSVNEVTARRGCADSPAVNADVFFVVRPENISVQDKDAGSVKAVVQTSVFVGSHVEYDLLFNEKTAIKASVDFKPDMKLYQSGDIVSLGFDEKTTLFLDR